MPLDFLDRIIQAKPRVARRLAGHLDGRRHQTGAAFEVVNDKAAVIASLISATDTGALTRGVPVSLPTGTARRKSLELSPPVETLRQVLLKRCPRRFLPAAGAACLEQRCGLCQWWEQISLQQFVKQILSSADQCRTPGRLRDSRQ